MRPEDQQLKQNILMEIRRIASQYDGKPPGKILFERETGIRQSSWTGVLWARWGDALVEAGFAPNAFQAKSDEVHLLTKLCEAFRHFGRVASEAELRLYHRNVDPEFPSHGTFNLNFGSKAATLKRLAEWIKDKPEFSDLVAILPNAVIDQRTAVKFHKPVDGSVYLIKSGKHFKIGRSDEIERRMKEIRIALPETARLEHVIVTDDPAGIEAYWHRRFADRRANGEWFALKASDVLAFKRRKFM
jgi:Meiotically up-regulated gene 113